MTKNVENVKVGTNGLGTVRDDVSCLAASRSVASLLLNGALGCAGKKNNMKKLMIAASAALCAAVGFGDGITSANVVGYQTKALKGNAAYNLTVMTFKAAGKDADKMILGDISASADWVSGNDQVKTLKANGAVDQAYTFVNEADAIEIGCPAGWYLKSDFDDESIEDLTPYCKNSDPLPLGNGLLVLVGKASTTLTYAGEVLAADQPISLKGNAAYNITGNLSPVDITLGDITASNDWVAGNDQLKTVKDNGAVDQAYTFVNAIDALEIGCPAGWYLKSDFDDESIEDLTPYCKNSTPVNAGEAFFVIVGKSSTTITVPSAL